MIRITKIRNIYYGMEISDDDNEAMDELREFVGQGTPIILVEDISELETFDIYDKVIMVDNET